MIATRARRRALRPLSVRSIAVVGAALIALPLAMPASAQAAAVSAGSARAATADYPPELAPFYTQQLTWEACEEGAECAWLTVPLDYADPTGPVITVRVNRIKATGSAAEYQGAVVINPGGPGAGGLSFAKYAATQIAPKVNKAFDFIGFDPRGVGKSAPITCMTGRQTSIWLAQDATPDTPAEEKELMSLAKQMADGCLKFSPNLARHVGTENTIQDLDVLRAVLAQPKLNWIGFSYGTYLGTMYAEKFPNNVGRFILDGALNPANDGMQLSKGQSQGFQLAVTHFAADCGKHSNCPYPGGTKKVLAGINKLFAQLDAKPMPAGKGRKVTQADALQAVFLSMYSTTFWDSLRTALGQAKRNDGRGLMQLADWANDRVSPNKYASNMASAFPAIACWDGPATPDANGLRAAARAWSRHAPVPEMASSMSWSNAPCSQWFGHSATLPAPASSTTTAPIVIVGTKYDPATPYRWAVQLNQQLPTSTLLTFVGDGHTAYGGGSACIDSALDTYLLTGTPPAAGTICT